jgi:NAD+ diphosphatase
VPDSVPLTTFVPAATPEPEASAAGWWWLVRRAEVLVELHPDGPRIPSGDRDDYKALADGAPAQYIGSLDGRPCWAVDVAADAETPADTAFEGLYALHGKVPDLVWTIAGRAVQLVEWDRTHRFCGRCGTATELSSTPNERARKCPACSLLAFPRLAPAVIVLVERTAADGTPEALLAQGRNFGMRMYSTLAGFVEPGETIEEAVRREVREEVGVELADVNYVASQSWPFPHSLMLGFRATWASGEIRIDEREIADARWFRADDLPPIPGRISIARRLIDGWLTRIGAPLA